MGKILIGTSGWQYRHWEGEFYPKELALRDWLKFYAKSFPTVEVNSTFYHEVKTATYAKWLKDTPDDFVFSVKGNRFISHIKKLKDCQEPVKRFYENAKVLISSRVKVKPVVLWQMPLGYKENLARLEEFLKVLEKETHGFRHAFEFRNETWGDKEILKLIRSSGVEAAMVIQDWHAWLRLTEPVGAFCYIRFHGKDQLYASCYSEKELEFWAKKIGLWSRKRDVYAYFNNDAQGNAVKNAQTLKRLVGSRNILVPHTPPEMCGMTKLV